MAVPTSPRSVLNGRYAEAAINGSLVALLFDWEVTVNTDTADVTAHGDYWKFEVPLDSGWTFRCRGYVVPSSASHYINSVYASGTLPANVTIAAYSGTVSGGTLIWAGTGTVVRGSLTAPMALAEQELEFHGYGAPSTGV